jgi:hypothetical protein
MVLDEIGRYVALIVLSPSFITFFIFFLLLFLVKFQAFRTVFVKKFITRDMTPCTVVQVYQDTSRHIHKVGDIHMFI